MVHNGEVKVAVAGEIPGRDGLGAAELGERGRDRRAERAVAQSRVDPVDLDEVGNAVAVEVAHGDRGEVGTRPDRDVLPGHARRRQRDGDGDGSGAGDAHDFDFVSSRRDVEIDRLAPAGGARIGVGPEDRAPRGVEQDEAGPVRAGIDAGLETARRIGLDPVDVHPAGAR